MTSHRYIKAKHIKTQVLQLKKAKKELETAKSEMLSSLKAEMDRILASYTEHVDSWYNSAVQEMDAQLAVIEVQHLPERRALEMQEVQAQKVWEAS